MKVLLVDDHPLFIAGIRGVLETLGPDVEVLEAGTAQRALGVLDVHLDFDYLCLDLQLPDMDGFDLLAELNRRRLPVPVLIMSANESPDIVHRALKSGAAGYLSKSAPIGEIRQAFDDLERKGRYVSPRLRPALDAFRAGVEHVAEGRVALSARQREVLRLLGEGLNNRDIANRLGVSLSTVKWHVSILFALLDTENRTSCAVAARRLGLID